MKKIQAMDEAGRSMAEKRYGSIASKSQYGHSQMGQNLSKKYQMQVGGIPPAAPRMAPPVALTNPSLPANLPTNIAQGLAAPGGLGAIRDQAISNAQARNAALQARVAAGRQIPPFQTPVQTRPNVLLKRGGRAKRGK